MKRGWLSPMEPLRLRTLDLYLLDPGAAESSIDTPRASSVNSGACTIRSNTLHSVLN
eukprot:CAMPEP_0119317076 /NCGR_PEP_ID=MMETSP1333-20130426/41884_1 /TAXON_ID=418940 /ORGANISM="Scyphosphaera apsteinii, Strain RCC1455" /LENGTH=56 /DNA_ID=CAMNT_0007322907 /DNA_START=71 /DNA_END=241 /DNA_ORIENTATION=+